MVFAQVHGLLLEQRHQMPRFSVTGISARHEHGVDAREFREHIRPLLEREVDLLRIPIVLVERRIPYPDVLPVFVCDARHFHHHLHLRKRKVRAVGGVV